MIDGSLPLPHHSGPDLHPAGYSGHRRARSSPTLALTRTLRTPDFEIDLDSRCARYPDGEEVRFTPHQFQVLALLIEALPGAVSRVRLAEEVVGTEAGIDGLDHLAVVISQLRRKLEPEPGVARYFPCVDADTYRFDPDGWGFELRP